MNEVIQSSVNKYDFAIHYRPDDPSERWIEYCKQNNIAYKIVDCWSNSIIDDMHDAACLLWLWQPNERYFAYFLTLTLESMGKVVFPSSSSSWYLENKIAQKYLFDSLGIPRPTSRIFYNQDSAFEYLDSANASFPCVIKLSSSRSGENVWLGKSRRAAKGLIRDIFAGKNAKIKLQEILRRSIRKTLTSPTSADLLVAVKAAIKIILPRYSRALIEGQGGPVIVQDYISGGGRAFFVGVFFQKRIYAFSWNKNLTIFVRQETESLNCVLREWCRRRACLLL